MTKFALLLPGQGAQAVGMGKAFYDRFPESREVYKQANAHLGFDVAALCFEGPQDALTKTETCQPALLVTSVAAYAAFRASIANVDVVGAAGLSLGELTALAVADAVKFSDALYLVQARANAMAQCAARNPGAMLAVIGLAREPIAQICRQAGVTAANFNAADQVVLSGAVPGIEYAEQLAKSQGAKRAVRLEVAGAFHSPLMQEASDEFKKALSNVSFRAPKFPVISNVTAEPLNDPAEIPGILARQIVSPVIWDGSMQWFVRQGTQLFVEFPPARVLTGLLRQIDRAAKAVPVNEPSDLEKLSGTQTSVD